MEFGLSQEQRLFQDSIRRFLEQHSPLERVRRAANANETAPKELWDGLCAMGVPGC